MFEDWQWYHYVFLALVATAVVVFIGMIVFLVIHHVQKRKGTVKNNSGNDKNKNDSQGSISSSASSLPPIDTPAASPEQPR